MITPWLLSEQPRTACLVLGYVAPEYIRALRALAVLSPMWVYSLSVAADGVNAVPDTALTHARQTTLAVKQPHVSHVHCGIPRGLDRACRV